MLRRSLLLAAGLCVAIPAGYWLMSQAAGNSSVVVEQKQTGTPKLVMDRTTYDFGVMDVGESGSHAFTIRNEGTAPLTIEVGSTSCKCTLLKVPKAGIPPGESAEIKVEWKTIDPVDGFRHGGTLWTNDPDCKAQPIFVEGKVRSRVLARPDHVVFSNLIPKEKRAGDIAIVSQVWDDFTLEPVECTVKGVTVTAVAADTTQIRKDDPWARAAHRLHLSYDGSLPVGTHQGVFRYRVRVPDNSSAGEKVHELPVAVDVNTPFTIHGKNTDGNFVIWGPVLRGKGRRESVLVVARGVSTDLEIRDVQCEPDVLKATVRRTDQKTGSTARFAVDLTLPADAPVVDCMTKKCVVNLETSDPQFPKVRFYVEFAVVE